MEKVLILMKNMPEIMDAALITSDVNRRYYTEFPSSAGTVVVTREQAYLIIDARYFEVASENAVNCKVILQDKLYPQIAELLSKHNVKKVGIENAHVSVLLAEKMKSELSAFELITDNSLSDAINEQRAIKCKTEQAYMQIAQDFTDQTFDYALSIAAVGKTEKEIALDMEFYGRKMGAEEVAFSFIVASGSNTSRPHAVPGDRKVEKGDFLLMDFGLSYKGYLSDMTRTIAMGVPSGKQKDVYETVLSAQLESMKLIEPGVAYKDVHQKAADIIDATPYKGLFTHGLGHSVGMDIHEPPNFNCIQEGTIVAGNVITVEPGIYIPGEFGVRIEDFVYITEDGFTNFTHSLKELIIL